jgi:PHD/YefM family antitoxin component YafN of YafNO toxin-antitoxin module
MTVNPKEYIKPISYFKTNADEMIEYINEQKSPIIITQQGVACGVLLDMESYQEMLNTLAMLQLIEISEQAIKEGRTYKHEDVAAEMRNRLEQKLKQKNG